MGSTRVIAELVREPHAICSGVIKIRRTMGVAPPHEAEYQAVGSEMIDGPGLDVVELDELESMNAESAGKSGEYRWVRFDNGEGPANEVVLLRLLWLLFIDLHVEQLRVVAVCTRCLGLLLASCHSAAKLTAIDPFFTLLVFKRSPPVAYDRKSVLGLEFDQHPIFSPTALWYWRPHRVLLFSCSAPIRHADASSSVTCR